MAQPSLLANRGDGQPGGDQTVISSENDSRVSLLEHPRSRWVGSGLIRRRGVAFTSITQWQKRATGELKV